MPIHRRRFRIEEAFIGGDMPMPAATDGEVGPMHREIMNELRAIRLQMGSAGPARSVTVETLDASVTREVAEAHALLSYEKDREIVEKAAEELRNAKRET